MRRATASTAAASTRRWNGCSRARAVRRVRHRELNRGHVTGQCHTTGMRDPAQYLDASRNATMNANVAR
jgi:hypothetical protein